MHRRLTRREEKLKIRKQQQKECLYPLRKDAVRARDDNDNKVQDGLEEKGAVK